MHIVMLRMGINERIEISSYGRVCIEIQKAKKNLLAISARNPSRVVVIQCFPTNFHFLPKIQLCLFTKIKNMIIFIAIIRRRLVKNCPKRKCNVYPGYVPLSYCGKQGVTVQRAPSEMLTHHHHRKH